MRSVEIVQGDLGSYESVLRAAQGARWIFSLAALVSIPYSYISPEENVATNVEGTLHVLQAARATGVERIIHTSSSEVYGTAHYVPMDESHPLQGQSPYSASKIGADKLAESFYRSFDLPVVTLRPFNVYGPRQSTRAVIPTIITQLLRDEEIRLGNLHPTRDFTYVSDTASAFLKAATASEVVGKEVNVGSGHEISISGLVDLLGTITDKSPRIMQDSQRMRPARSEVDRLYSDSSLAKRLLDWEPTVPLEEGLRRTVEWVAQNIHFYLSKTYGR